MYLIPPSDGANLLNLQARIRSIGFIGIYIEYQSIEIQEDIFFLESDTYKSFLCEIAISFVGESGFD